MSDLEGKAEAPACPQGMSLLGRQEKFAMPMVGDVHRIKRRQSIAMILVDIPALAN